MKKKEVLEMHDAILSHDIALVKQLAAKKQLIEERDSYGRTPLMVAIIEELDEVVSILLKNGANADAQDKDGYAALHFAVDRFQVKNVQALIKSNVKIDIQDANGNTPLSNAVFEYEGKGDIIKLLLKAGAKPKLKNFHGVSPLELAQSIANYDVAKFFG
ncbi:ankyrin repeat domain-containing protein [Leptospira sp. WS58.C1]|uniref:ankyrin repeat domain-containing protein n=1 Tax=Leptospira cinconiae TaxID=3235173 RepID=UPI00349ED5C4